MIASFSMNENTFPAKVDQIGNICRMVTDWARAAGMDEKCIWKLETAVDEACTNISCYGYQDNPEGKIWVRCVENNGQFIVIIEDIGTPFDQTKPTDPEFDKDICERRPGGFGRYIMRQFLDDMRYEHRNGRNVLTLVKRMRECAE